MNVRKAIIWKLLLQRLNHMLPRMCLLVPLLILISLLFTRVPAHRADVDHAISELNECTAHRRQTLEVGDVLEAKFGELLVFLFADPGDEGLRGQGSAHAVGGQAVFGEAEVEEGDDGGGRGGELLFLFDEVGTADLSQSGVSLG